MWTLLVGLVLAFFLAVMAETERHLRRVQRRSNYYVTRLTKSHRHAH